MTGPLKLLQASTTVQGCAEAMGRDVHTFYTLPGALALQAALEKIDKGHFIVNIAKMPIKCPVAPIEAVLLADYYFHKRGTMPNIPFVPAHMSLVGKNLDQTKEAKKAKSLKTSDIMTKNVITISQGTTLHDTCSHSAGQ